MVKKLLTVIFGLTLAFGASAQLSNIDPDDVQFWVGSGSNSTVVAIGWDDEDAPYTPTVVIWGVRWNGNIYLLDALDSIATYDSRFTYTFGGGMVGSVDYNDPAAGIHLSPSAYFNCNSYGGAYGSTYLGTAHLRISESTCSNYNFTGINNIIYASNPGGSTPADPVDATLAHSDILYWVGTGSNEALFIVNFAQPDTAFAWGYRFNTGTTIQQMINDIDAADPRLRIIGNPSNGGDIRFALSNGDSLGLSPADPSVGYNFWWTNLNGMSVASMTTTLQNNDFFKYGDLNSATGWDFQYGFYMQEAWTKVPTPVSVPDTSTPVLCDALALPYSDDFSGYVADQTVRPYMAAAKMPTCWTMLGNGTTQYVNSTSTNSTYFGGVGYSTSTNSFGAIAANDAFFALIASQIYTGTNATHIASMNETGTRRYAMLPEFEQPLSQIVLSFDRRTSGTGARLVVGYVTTDTASFVGLDTIVSDNRVLHHDTIHFNQYANIPANARLAFMWQVTSSTASTTGPGYRYCGIDNLNVALDTPEPPVEVEATIAASDILYWVGQGSDSAIFVISNGVDTRAWGYLFNEAAEPTALNMASAIAAADPRLVYDMDFTTFEMDFSYKEGSTVIKIGDTRFKVDGVLAATGDELSDVDVEDGMMVVVSSDPAAVWTTPITPATVKNMPENSTIAASDILYWVGEGTNEAVVVVNWGVPDTALAWGLRFNDAVTIGGAIDSIANADPRVTTDAAHSTINYTDGTVSLSFQPAPASYMQFILGNNSNVNASTALSNGDQLKIGESAYGIGYDSTEYYGMWYPMGVVWNTEIHPVTVPDTATTPVIPTPEDAAIAASDILYWVGEGSNQVVLAVNWADSALAWGYRFSTSTVTVQQMMDAIAAADPRFSYMAAGFVNDINYIDTAAGMTDTLGVTPGNYWWSLLNHVGGMGLGDVLHNGDFYKWGDLAVAVVVDSTWIDYGQNSYWDYTYVWPYTIHPVSVPDTATTPVIPTPEDAAIAASDILYWVGEGSNQVVLAVNWADSALAWGYRFSTATVTVQQMMDAIAAADPRFSYMAAGFVNDINYIDTAAGMTDTLGVTPGNYWWSLLNHVGGMGLGDVLHNGDFYKWGDLAVAVVVDSTWIDYGQYSYWDYTYVWPYTIHPVSVPGTPVTVDATISASDILFWVGHGENEAILAVNWADSALAWGYRFSTDSVSSATMLADIAAADPRLTVEGAGYVSDILYIDTAAGMTDTLAITPGNWWSSLLNGYSDMGAGQMLHDGDLQKWGDPAAGVIVDSMDWDGYIYYTYVFPMTIHPVTVPDTTGSTPGPQPEHGPFCGPAGTEGSTAIAADSSVFVAWATGVSVTRGPKTIANPGLGLAATGSEENAIGMATLSDVYDVVSLGDGGTALVTFAHPIRNGEGPDFAVFENGFSDNSLELAFVEVSSDGERFVRFPSTCLTQTETQLGNAGQTDPTNLNNLAGKYRIGFGTPFDLEELADSTGIDIDSIVYVRIVDVVGSINPEYGTYDAFGHIINDPWPTPFDASGFDLTGVGVIYERIDSTHHQGIENVAATVESLWPNPTADRVNISVSRAAEAVLYDQTGRMMGRYTLRQGTNTLDLSHLSAGVYILRAGESNVKVVKK